MKKERGRQSKRKSPFNNTFVDFSSVKDMTIGQMILKYNDSLKIAIPSISKTIWAMIKDNNLLK